MISDNHSGIVWSLMALIILTLVGVFLSMLVDKRISFSSSRNAVVREIAENERELYFLADQLSAKMQELDDSSSQSGLTDAEAGNAGNRLQILKRDLASLVEEKARLRTGIRETGEEFAEYRETYRKAEWAAAAGERIDSLFLKTGRHFERVVIHRVTDQGLEISHSRGSARIGFKDLGSDYRSRFQWDEEGSEAPPAREQSNSPKPEVRPREADPVRPAPQPAPAPPDEAAIAALRKEITLWRTKISSLKSEYAVAASQESRRSVPGSLRTWGEQASILRASIARSEAGLAVTMDQLRTLSPNDPALSFPRR